MPPQLLAAGQVPAGLADGHGQIAFVPQLLEVAAMGAAHHRMVVDPAEVLPEAPGAVLPAVQEHGVEAGQADEVGRGDEKGPPGNQDGDPHNHEEPGGQAPGFFPDNGIRQGPGQPHPEPKVGTGLPEEQQQPQGPAESRYQVARVLQESPPPVAVASGQ